MITRRGLLAGILGAAAAPAIITRPGILMPVRTIALPEPWWMTADLWVSEQESLLSKSPTKLIMTPLGAAQLYDSGLFSSYPGTLRYRATNRYVAR